MTNKEYANLLVPNVKNDYKYYEEKYPERNLSEDKIVTRFAPSPTGTMHKGNLLSAFTGFNYAKQSGGIFFLRVEDTDQKREVDGGTENIIEALGELNIIFDEGHTLGGNYGPYLQSERKDIYHAFVKKLIEDDLAYPCFCSSEEISEIRAYQEKNKKRIGYYGKYAKCRNLSKEDVINKVNNGEKYIIRLKSPGSFYEKVVLDDLIRGKIEMPENDIDEVILKTDGLPTYHFAHAIDDHLMRSTHIIRGDEWISSYPKHDQLFKALGFKVPKYAHISPINIKDGETVRKLSKRKDPWAAVSYYNESGIPSDVMKLYLATLINSNFEEWYHENTDKDISDFTFSFNKMSISGPIFDLEKLKNISKTYFARLKADTIYNNLLTYTKKYDEEFYNIISKNKDYVIGMLNIERDVPKPRKDIFAYSNIKNIYWFMFDELFDKNEDDYEEVTNVSKEDFIDYVTKYYDEEQSQEDWFNALAIYADTVGYTKDRKAYKENPDNYKGTTADFCKVLRIIITKKNLSPNLYDVIRLLGKDKLLDRVYKYLK